MNGFGAFLVSKPSAPEWKSAWRKNFEQDYARRMAEARLAPRMVKPRCVAAPKPKPEVRAKAPKERAPRKSRAKWPPKMLTLCQCGRSIKRKDRMHCAQCIDKPRALGLTPKCTECGAVLNANNKIGLCRKHAHSKVTADRWALHGPRTECTFQEDGMRCTQLLYRSNATGLCRWHVARNKRSVGQPRMVPA